MSRCPPSPARCMQARRFRSGSSTAISSRSRFRCCRWPRSAKSSVTAASIWPDLCSSRWRRLFCALSHTLLLLTVARIMQGFGAAGIMSVNTALVRYTYPRAQLGRGIGVNALVVAISAAVGPTVAAAILAVGTWPYLFAINVPLGIATLVLGWRTCRIRRAASSRLRLAECWSQRGDLRSRHRRDRQRRPWRSGVIVPDRVRRRRRRRVHAGIRQTHMASPLLPVDLLRIPDFRAVDFDLDRLVLRARCWPSSRSPFISRVVSAIPRSRWAF